jgi:hypothetical protein
VTHNELVMRAEKWLRGTMRCPVVITERLGLAHVCERHAEMPDAIGWSDHNSILVECKTSRTDLLADRTKKFRGRGGAGDTRYIMSDKGVIQPDWIQPGWGLLWVTGKIVRVIRRPKMAGACAIGLRRERYLLTAHVLRIESLLAGGPR